MKSYLKHINDNFIIKLEEQQPYICKYMLIFSIIIKY